MPPVRGRRVLPFIRDLNPQRDDLPGIIGLAKQNEGNRAALVEAVYRKFTTDGRRSGFSRHSIEANTVSSLAADNLGIIDDAGRLTDLGKKLHRKRNRLDEFKAILAVHILRNRAGWQFARALQVIRRRGRRPTRQEVAEYLGEKYGIQEWRDLNNISSLHSFLEWCGVVSNYQLNEVEFERLVGASVTDVSKLERFTLETRGCLEALVRLGGSATAGAIREAAESHLRRPIDPHKMPSRMKPLIDAELVTFRGRRGERTSTYTILDRKKGELLAQISSDLAVVGVIPDEVFEHDFAWVIERLHDGSLNNDEKARSLEVLAAMICWKLGLRHILLREKTPFEVDVTAEYVGTGYQTWSAQCKAYGSHSIRSDHLLREFGIGILNHHSVLLFVTTADFTDDAVFTAERIMRESPTQVLMLNDEDLLQIARDEGKLFRMVTQRSAALRQLRAGDPPGVILREFDAAKDWLLGEKPLTEEVWLYLERRDFVTTRPMVAALLYAWLESQRSVPGFDEAYLERLKGER
jgi:hypothetical protein